jgi:hypothetical protein
MRVGNFRRQRAGREVTRICTSRPLCDTIAWSGGQGNPTRILPFANMLATGGLSPSLELSVVETP